MYKGYRYSTFSYFDNPKAANFMNTRDLALIGGGGAVGNIAGALVGAYRGATYNPDIVDKKTGELRKLNAWERSFLVQRRAITDGLKGAAAGAGVGALGAGAYRLATRGKIPSSPQSFDVDW